MDIYNGNYMLYKPVGLNLKRQFKIEIHLGSHPPQRTLCDLTFRVLTKERMGDVTVSGHSVYIFLFYFLSCQFAKRFS